MEGVPVNMWNELATALFEFNRELRLSGFTSAEALVLTSEVTKTIIGGGMNTNTGEK